MDIEMMKAMFGCKPIFDISFQIELCYSRINFITNFAKNMLEEEKKGIEKFYQKLRSDSEKDLKDLKKKGEVHWEEEDHYENLADSYYEQATLQLEDRIQFILNSLYIYAYSSFESSLFYICENYDMKERPKLKKSEEYKGYVFAYQKHLEIKINLKIDKECNEQIQAYKNIRNDIVHKSTIEHTRKVQKITEEYIISFLKFNIKYFDKIQETVNNI